MNNCSDNVGLITVMVTRPAYCKAKATKFGLKAKAKD